MKRHPRTILGVILMLPFVALVAGCLYITVLACIRDVTFRYIVLVFLGVALVIASTAWGTYLLGRD